MIHQLALENGDVLPLILLQQFGVQTMIGFNFAQHGRTARVNGERIMFAN